MDVQKLDIETVVTETKPEVEEKKKRGQHGKITLPIWHYKNVLTNIEKDFGSITQMAEEFGLTRQTIYNIIKRKHTKNKFVKQVYDAITITKLRDDDRGKHLLKKIETV